MAKRGMRIIIAIAVALLVIFVLLFSYRLIKKPNILVGKPAKLLVIPPGICFSALQDSLYQEAYVADTASFSLLARLMKYERRIMPGAYKLKPGMGNWDAIKILMAGMQDPIKIVLHNMHNKAELSAKITQNIGIKAADFAKLLDDSVFISQYGFNTDNVLAMFIPNTYMVYWTISPKELFQRMYLEYQRFWDQERLNKAKQIGLTPTEVTILASIVQKETNRLEEAPVIAGIYLNRLRKGMRLQSCPTLLHAVGNPSARRVLRKYQRIDSPYNTYLYKGLPPGPITIPPIAMIDAVLNHQQHDYLYFSAKEDFSGCHYFARTFSEHKNNGERYRRALNQAGIY
ncbi:MAG: endolytic transglycosylase MltG [Bacteroidota bacterium]